VRQVTVLSFTPNQELHAVFHFPQHGRPRKLQVVGSVLAQVNEFVGAEPFTATRYVIEPVFAFEDRIALGTEFMDSPSVIAVPARAGQTRPALLKSTNGARYRNYSFGYVKQAVAVEQSMGRSD